MGHLIKAVLGLAVLGAAFTSPASAGDDDQVETLRKRVAALEDENSLLTLRCWWLQRLRGYENRPTASGSAVIHVVGGASDQRDERLRAIRLPASPSKNQVREYLALIIVAAQERSVFGPGDPEIGMMKQVGASNVDVLLEPILYLGHFNGSSYVSTALNALVAEEHKSLILKFLPFSQKLAEVVVTHGWTTDAAPILLKRLAERTPYITQDWIDASVEVAGPENYEDLKFQLAHGQNPWSVWLAIRGLPGMEPLDDFVANEWRGTPLKTDSWERRSFAVVAAHYGQVDALGVMAKNVKDKGDWHQPFRDLTGYQGPIEGAASWWERNQTELTFDSTKRVYVRSSSLGK